MHVTTSRFRTKCMSMNCLHTSTLKRAGVAPFPRCATQLSGRIQLCAEGLIVDPTSISSAEVKGTRPVDWLDAVSLGVPWPTFHHFHAATGALTVLGGKSRPTDCFRDLSALSFKRTASLQEQWPGYTTPGTHMVTRIALTSRTKEGPCYCTWDKAVPFSEEPIGSRSTLLNSLGQQKIQTQT